MKKYRLTLILKSSLKKEEKEKLLKQVQTWGGKMDEAKIKELGEKKFAYNIRSEQKGDYVLMEFSNEALTPELEGKIRLNENVLRHLLVRD